MSNVISDFQLLCACGVSYNIPQNPLPNDVYYRNAQFLQTPTVIQATTFPETAACLIGQSQPTGQTQSAVILAFRGTTYSSISDWATDLFAEPFTPAGFPAGDKLHPGFYYSTLELVKQLTDAIAALKLSTGTPVYITGHSKGGAMASIAAYMLCEAGILTAADVTVTTFASPAPGNGNFMTTFKTQFPQGTTNYINYLDLVPFLPPGVLLSDYITSNDNSNAFLNALLTDFTSFDWNYMSCNSMVNYISGDTPATITSETANDFYNYIPFPSPSDGYNDLEAINTLLQAAISSGNIKGLEAILNAHSHALGGGYWNAICPPNIS